VTLKEQEMIPTELVSFDMDGTITDLSFVDSVWLEGIPRLLAEKQAISLEDAKKYAKKEYDKVGRERLEWYDLRHWAKKFGLDISPDQVLGSYQHKIKTFPEVPEVLTAFREKGYRLIVVSNARREFLDLELQKTGIGHYFERVFSSTSDFRLTKKTVDIYRRVCGICGVSPNTMVHVGDDRSFDFEIPRKLGIKAFYLDRACATSGEFVIGNLKELGQKFVH